MATMTYANLFSEARNNVLALLSIKSNVADPTQMSTQTRKWIYSREPDVKASDFSGYPYIILHGADVDIEQKVAGSVDGKSKMVYWNHEIEIITSDRGYAEKDGQGLSYMDSISNDVVETFMNITNRNTLSGYLMQFSNVTTTKVVSETRHNQKCYVRSVLLELKSKMQVSA